MTTEDFLEKFTPSARLQLRRNYHGRRFQLGKNKDIVGISVNNNQIKLSQYADDTTLVLNGSEKWLIAFLRIIENFGKLSGLCLNNKKPKALWIVSNTGKDLRLCPESTLPMDSK